MTAAQLIELMTRVMEAQERQHAEIKKILEESNRMMDEATKRIEAKLNEIDRRRKKVSGDLAAEHFSEAGL